MNRVLVFISDQSINPESLYNPSDLPIYRKGVTSDFSQQVNGKEGQLVLLEYVSGNQWKVVRRIKWPYSDESYQWLTYEGPGSGSGPINEENRPLKLGTEDQQKFGIGLGLGPDISLPGLPDPKKIIWWVIIGILAYNELNRR